MLTEGAVFSWSAEESRASRVKSLFVLTCLEKTEYEEATCLRPLMMLLLFWFKLLD